MNSILYNAIGTLDTFTDGWQTIVNNVANSNTDDFKARHARYEDGPNGQGVRLSGLATDNSAGAVLEAHRDEVTALSRERAQAAAEEAAAQAAVDARAAEYREASNVQLEREMTEAIAQEYAYKANAALISTYDDMMGTVLDIVI